MRERAELLGGTLQIESTPGQGTAVSARIPVRRQDAVTPLGESATAR
jgi:nitrate/nitrite-specific signal transduction histidine kinase